MLLLCPECWGDCTKEPQRQGATQWAKPTAWIIQLWVIQSWPSAYRTAVIQLLNSDNKRQEHDKETDFETEMLQPKRMVLEIII